MDFAIEDTEEQKKLRKEVREFLEKNVPPGITHTVDAANQPREQYELRRELGRRLGKKGWLYPHMPKEYGGSDMSADQVMVINDELTRIGLALPPYYDSGGRMGAPSILVWGTEEHKK